MYACINFTVTLTSDNNPSTITFATIYCAIIHRHLDMLQLWCDEAKHICTETCPFYWFLALARRVIETLTSNTTCKLKFHVLAFVMARGV